MGAVFDLFADIGEKIVFGKQAQGEAPTPESFEALYEKYKVQVLHLALNYVEDIDEAENIRQEVFLRAHRALPNFRGNSKFGTYLYKITVNCSLDHLKKRAKTPEISLEEIFNESKEIGINEKTPEDILIEKEQQRIIYQTIQRLSEAERVVVEMIMHGFSVA